MTLSVLTAPLERDHAGADTRTAAIIEQQRSADELAAQRAAGGGASRGDQPAAHTQHTDACVLHHFGLLKSNCTIFFSFVCEGERGADTKWDLGIPSCIR